MDNVRRRYTDLKSAVTALEGAVSVILLVMLSLLLMVQVFSRYVLSSPLGWSEEVARYTFVWLVFMGSAFLAAKNSHIAVTFLADRFGPQIARWAVRLSSLVVALAAGLTAWKSVAFVAATSGLLSPGTGIPMGLVYAAPALGFGLIAIHSVEYVITGEIAAEGKEVTEVAL